jgi:NADH-quinone oxidoreductase subunit C
MADVQTLAARVRERFADLVQEISVGVDMVTLELPRARMGEVFLTLRDERQFAFEQLTDLCGVDYLDYGLSEWTTAASSDTGFSRGVEAEAPESRPWTKPRFATVYHLISYRNNQRLRVRVFAEDEPPLLDSVVGIWASASWFEREAFDLYGILFVGHPDLRRILTDYGFVGHPFRKDFPLSGNVEMRYDPVRQRVVYEPVSIEPRVLVPRVIRAEPQPAQRSGEGNDA